MEFTPEQIEMLANMLLSAALTAGATHEDVTIESAREVLTDDEITGAKFFVAFGQLYAANPVVPT